MQKHGRASLSAITSLFCLNPLVVVLIGRYESTWKKFSRDVAGHPIHGCKINWQADIEFSREKVGSTRPTRVVGEAR
jgi:hypothetical protein